MRTIFLFSILSLVGFLNSSCGENDRFWDRSSVAKESPDEGADLNIRNGIVTSEFPHVGLLERNDGWRCTATVLPQKQCMIITARHCVGESRFKLDGKSPINVLSWIDLPTGSPDVVLGVLESKPIDLPATGFTLADTDPSTNALTTVVGYSPNGNREIGAVPTKRRGTLQVIGNVTSELRTEDGRQYLSQTISQKSTTGDNALCAGDSGGPTFSSGAGPLKLLGINSSGTMARGPHPVCVRQPSGDRGATPSGFGCATPSAVDGLSDSYGGCHDAQSGLVWMGNSATSAHLLKLAFIRSRQIVPPRNDTQQFAREFCETLPQLTIGRDVGLKEALADLIVLDHLTNPDASPTPTRAEAIQQADSMIVSFANGIENHRDWRQPSAAELSNILGANLSRGTKILGTIDYSAFWSSDPNRASYYDGRFLTTTGGVPNECNRTVVNQSVSIAHYRTSIQPLINAVNCDVGNFSVDALNNGDVELPAGTRFRLRLPGNQLCELEKHADENLLLPVNATSCQFAQSVGADITITPEVDASSPIDLNLGYWRCWAPFPNPVPSLFTDQNLRVLQAKQSASDMRCRLFLYTKNDTTDVRLNVKVTNVDADGFTSTNDGRSSVTGTGGISCSIDTDPGCTTSVRIGSQIELLASPTTGKQVKAWRVYEKEVAFDLSNRNRLRFTARGHVSVEAILEPLPVPNFRTGASRLRVEVYGQGEVLGYPLPTRCTENESPCIENLLPAGVQNLYVNPASGWRIKSVDSNDPNCRVPGCSLTLNSVAKVVTVVFEEAPPIIVLPPQTVTPSTQITLFNSNCSSIEAFLDNQWQLVTGGFVKVRQLGDVVFEFRANSPPGFDVIRWRPAQGTTLVGARQVVLFGTDTSYTAECLSSQPISSSTTSVPSTIQFPTTTMPINTTTSTVTTTTIPFQTTTSTLVTSTTISSHSTSSTQVTMTTVPQLFLLGSSLGASIVTQSEQTLTVSQLGSASSYTFIPYSDPEFVGEINVAVLGDGSILTVPAPGSLGGPHLKKFAAGTTTVAAELMAYGAGFTGGVNLANGDTNGDGLDEIITAPGAGGGPHVKIWNSSLQQESGGFMAYSSGFTGGVNVAVCDVDLDNREDIVTAPGPGGGPHVRVFDSNGVPKILAIANFMAYSLGFTGGVLVACADFDGDRRGDVVTAPASNGGPHVKVFSGANGQLLGSFMAYPENYTAGLSELTTADVNQDGIPEVIVSYRGEPSKAFRYDGSSIMSFPLRVVGARNP